MLEQYIYQDGVYSLGMEITRYSGIDLVLYKINNSKWTAEFERLKPRVRKIWLADSLDELVGKLPEQLKDLVKEIFVHGEVAVVPGEFKGIKLDRRAKLGE